MPPQLLSLYNVTQGTLLCAQVELADTFISRFRGLLGRRAMPSGTALWLRPSSGVHTIGMQFPIDVVALADDLTVLSLKPDLAPWRVAAAHPRTRSVLELPSGCIFTSSLRVGDQLRVSL